MVGGVIQKHVSEGIYLGKLPRHQGQHPVHKQQVAQKLHLRLRSAIGFCRAHHGPKEMENVPKQVHQLLRMLIISYKEEVIQVSNHREVKLSLTL